MELINRFKKYCELVMFSHTFFSLPFAMISMIWAANGLPQIKTIFWILTALISARNGANAINRVIDTEYDAKNRRTSHRHIPQGQVSKKEAVILTAILFIIFEISAFMINKLCFYLSPIAIFLFIIYSYTKRFTWACHIILGITCAGAPVGAWIAVTGKLSIIPFLIGITVMFWISGFDIIYATQDIEFDRQEGLYSIPAYFGLRKSLLIAKFFHILSLLILFSLTFIVHTHWIYLLGLLLISYLLLIEHKIVNPKDIRIMKKASYSINQLVSISFFVFSLIDFILYGGIS